MSDAEQEHQVLEGIPASGGIAIGRAFLLDSEEIPILRESLEADRVAEEVKRFESVIQQTRDQIRQIQDKISSELGVEQAEIFNAHLMFLEDKVFIGEVAQRIEAERICAEFIFADVLRKYIQAFSVVEDDYMRERTSDVEDVGRRILRNLTGLRRRSLGELTHPVILVAYDLSPSDTATMSREHVIGFLTDIGGRTSHTAIMAKSLEVPAVVGLEVATGTINPNDLLIVDGSSGKIIINPDDKTLEHYENLKERLESADKALLSLKDQPSRTPDGHDIHLAANIELPEEVPQVLAYGAEGVGLYRTEFLYMNRNDLPSEEEQYEAYKQVAMALAPQPVIIRTIDLGGDKFLSQLRIPREMNPFLGWRAIRFCLARPDFFKTQLRAILRASASGNVKFMYPLVSGVEELRLANQILELAKMELSAEGKAFNPDIEVGAMIEVPSAAMIMDLLSKEVQFFSIGTNDLIQYALAVDRVNEKIAYLYEPTHPAVLRLLKKIIDDAHAHERWVGLCGEMSGEPALTLLLLGMGLDSFSTSPVNLPRIKQVIRSVPLEKAKKVLEAVMQLDTGKEIEAYAQKRLEELVPELCTD